MTSCSRDRNPADYLDLYAVHALDDNAAPQATAVDGPKVGMSSRAIRRLSLQVSTDLHRQLKLLAMDEEETMNSMVVRILRQFLKERDAKLRAMKHCRPH